MDWLPFTALSALGIGIWHETNRFPATDKTFRKLMERVDNLESENYDLKEKIELLDSELQSLSDNIDQRDGLKYNKEFDYEH